MLTSGFINSFSSRSPPTKGKNTRKCLLEVVRMQPVVQAWASNRWSESEKKFRWSQNLNAWIFFSIWFTPYTASRRPNIETGPILIHQRWFVCYLFLIHLGVILPRSEFFENENFWSTFEFTRAYFFSTTVKGPKKPPRWIEISFHI